MYPVSRACWGWVCAHWWQVRQSRMPLHRQSVCAEWMPRRLRWWWSVPARPQRWQRQASRESTASLIQLVIGLGRVEELPVESSVSVEPVSAGISVADRDFSVAEPFGFFADRVGQGFEFHCSSFRFVCVV